MSILLQQALRLHQAGDLDKAQALYEQFLQKHPNDINGLQLLGSLYAAKKDFSQAVKFLKLSLEKNETQPQVMLNLAITYKQSGQIELAIKTYKRLIEIQPNDPSAYQFLSRLYADYEAYDDAIDLCDNATLATGEQVLFQSKKAELLAKINRFDDAINLYQSLIDEQPNDPDLIHGKALVLRRKGDAKQALQLFSRLQETGIKNYQLFHNMGNALSDLGRLQDAIYYYEQALALNSEYVHSHINLNELLWEVGEKQRFLSSYVQAIPLHPMNMPLKYAYCQSLLRTRNFAICQEFLLAVDTAQRNSAQYWDLLARSEKGLGNIPQCLLYYSKAKDCSDTSIEVQLNYAQALIESNKIDSAQEILESVVKVNSNDQFAWSLLGVCWRLKQDPREQQLNNYNDLVGEFNIDIPPGFESVEAFCQQLNTYLMDLHTGTNQPIEQTLTGGTQTRGNLFDNPHPLIQSLVVELRKCIDEFIANSSSYEFINKSEPNEPYDFSGSWSVSLKDSGFHTSHVHPMGWLSSAFYVSLPVEVEDTEAKQGWFCLGKPNIQTSPQLDAVKKVKPAVGKLVLFRSYMWHSTTAFNSENNRTTVAFDIVKCG